MESLHPFGNQSPKNYVGHTNNYPSPFQYPQDYPGVPLGYYPMMDSTTQGYPNTYMAYYPLMYEYQNQAYTREQNMLNEYYTKTNINENLNNTNGLYSSSVSLNYSKDMHNNVSKYETYLENWNKNMTLKSKPKVKRKTKKEKSKAKED